MAEICLALLLVATLGSVDPAASAIGVAEVKTAWEIFKPPNSVPGEITTCDSLPCDSGKVDPDAVGVDVGTLCTNVDTYLTCAGGCSLTDTQKQQLNAVEDLCKTADIETALAVIKGECSECDTDADAVDSTSGLDGKCQASLSYIDCVVKAKKATTCTSVDDADVETLKAPCKDRTIPLYDFGIALIDIKKKCDCESTNVDDAAGLDAKCLESLSYIECVGKTTSCNSVSGDEKKAFKTPCKDKSIPLYDFGIALVDIKENCDCESTTMDGASGLDKKCLASLSYIDCVGTAKATTCASVDEADVDALKTPCKDGSSPLYGFGIALIDIKENCPSGKCESTAVDDAAGLEKKCLESESYLGCVNASCSSVPDDDKEALKTACKAVATVGGGDDGCSILQVSTLALMLSLLLSII